MGSPQGTIWDTWTITEVLLLTDNDLRVSSLRLSDPVRNRVQTDDDAVHDWYRFVLSFPPHLVRSYLDKFEQSENSLVLDPFAGTGTTLVEAKKQGIPSVGVEANPVVGLAARVKTDWSLDPNRLKERIDEITEGLLPLIGVVSSVDGTTSISQHDLKRLPPQSQRLLIKGSISPLPLHKALTILEEINKKPNDKTTEYLKVALASTLVRDAGNLRFGPEIGITKPKVDVDVLHCWNRRACAISDDLRSFSSLADVPSTVFQMDARQALTNLEEESITAVITSPPYPNEKDYTRTTRLEDVVLGYIKDKADLQEVKKALVRSNTRGVYKADTDDEIGDSFPEVRAIAEKIEQRRIELGKTSGFERLYARVTKLYFGGMARHLAELRRYLKPNAQLAYVVGDQASYLRVLIRTAPILGHIAETLGYEVETIDLFRTRAATATRSQLREEVLILRWPGERR